MLQSREKKKRRVQFECTGHELVPTDVTHVNFISSVEELLCYDGGSIFYGCSQLKEVVLNEGLHKIGKWAFIDCTTLVRIELPSTLRTIGVSAFNSCESLSDIVLNEGLVNIEDGAFCGCNSLISISIPSAVTRIGKQAFIYCKNLKEVVLNEGLQNIDLNAFSCTPLESITLPSTLIEIGENAFRLCRNLNEVVLKKGIRKIGKCAFASCSALEGIIIPSSVTDIGDRAFADCSSLREVELNHEIQNMGIAVFQTCPSLERLLFQELSSRLAIIIQTGHYPRVEAQIDEVRGEVVERRGSEIFVNVAAMVGGWRSWNTIKQYLNRVVDWIKYYEMSEATTTFELALWKAKIDQEDDASSPINRDACRIEVPGTVKETILKFLGR